MLLRSLISLFFGFCLVMLYLIVGHYLFIYYVQHLRDYGYIPDVYLGLQLPMFIYLSVSSMSESDFHKVVSENPILTGLVFLANVLLYSIPLYLLLSLISLFRHAKRQMTDEMPPPPPSFDT